MDTSGLPRFENLRRIVARYEKRGQPSPPRTIPAAAGDARAEKLPESRQGREVERRLDPLGRGSVSSTNRVMGMATRPPAVIPLFNAADVRCNAQSVFWVGGYTIVRQGPAEMPGNYNEAAFVSITFRGRWILNELLDYERFAMISTGQKDITADKNAPPTRNGREREGIRTPGIFAQWFSRPPPSAARPSLRMPHAVEILPHSSMAWSGF